MLDCCGTIWSIKQIALLETHYIFNSLSSSCFDVLERTKYEENILK